jgi:hypothetical protein
VAAGVLGVALPMMLGTTGAEAADALHPDRADQPGPAPLATSAMRLPMGIEDLSPYEPQVSCDPHAKPGVKAFEDYVLALWHHGYSGGTVRACHKGALSEHKEGRAWDWMLNPNSYADVTAGQRVIDWLLADDAAVARRLGIMYIIWNERIWSAHKVDDGWQGYHGEDDHTSHIHFSFDWAGAEKRTSWWTGKVAPMEYGPCRKYIGDPIPPYGDTVNLKPCPKAVRKPKPKPKSKVEAPPTRAGDQAQDPAAPPTNPTTAQPTITQPTTTQPTTAPTMRPSTDPAAPAAPTAPTAAPTPARGNGPRPAPATGPQPRLGSTGDPAAAPDTQADPEDEPGPGDEVESDPDSTLDPRTETMPKHEPMPPVREPSATPTAPAATRRDSRPGR